MEINTKNELEKIVKFLRETSKKTNIKKFVIGLSGGIDSATSLYLLKEAFGLENVYVYHLFYFNYKIENINIIRDDLNIREDNFRLIDIKPLVDKFQEVLQIDDSQKIRLGNIMARIRMITLFDQAKKLDAMVCGTENRSEHYLSYFTRFGDEASDLEPIIHLFKTQVFKLAKELKIPEEIITQKPSADLWEGQSDEGEFGFSYKDADEILHLHFDKKKSKEELKKMGFQDSEKILDWVKSNEFKHKVPYTL